MPASTYAIGQAQVEEAGQTGSGRLLQHVPPTVNGRLFWEQASHGRIGHGAQFGAAVDSIGGPAVVGRCNGGAMEAAITDPPRPCRMCGWRRALIWSETEPDETDAPAGYCDSSWPAILEALHTYPGAMWFAIIGTNTLCPPGIPTNRAGSSRRWVRIPLRMGPSGNELAPSACHFRFEGQWYEPTDSVVAYHNTMLAHLIGPSCSGHGNGILHDRRLRYGVLTHLNNMGVNVYADGGLETFEGFVGWVQLEVRVCNTTKLTGGRSGRYCINGPSGEVCRKAVIEAMWVPTDELPRMVFVS